MAVMLRASIRNLRRGALAPALVALRWSVLLFAPRRAALSIEFGEYRRLRQCACLRTPLLAMPETTRGPRRKLSFLAMSKTGSRPLSLERRGYGSVESSEGLWPLGRP